MTAIIDTMIADVIDDIDAGDAGNGQIKNVLRAALDEIERLRTEVMVLRYYGNKDCTAMADAALEQKRETGTFPFED